MSGAHLKQYRDMAWLLGSEKSIVYYAYQVVPHKAVAEVSKIGNLYERIIVVRVMDG